MGLIEITLDTHKSLFISIKGLGKNLLDLTFIFLENWDVIQFFVERYRKIGRESNYYIKSLDFPQYPRFFYF